MQLLLRRATEGSTVSLGVPGLYFENPRSDEGEPHLFSKPQKLPGYHWHDKMFQRVICSLDHVCLAWREETKPPQGYLPNQPELTVPEMGTGSQERACSTGWSLSPWGGLCWIPTAPGVGQFPGLDSPLEHLPTWLGCKLWEGRTTSHLFTVQFPVTRVTIC